jgi:hypothetical protein
MLSSAVFCVDEAQVAVSVTEIQIRCHSGRSLIPAVMGRSLFHLEPINWSSHTLARPTQHKALRGVSNFSSPSKVELSATALGIFAKHWGAGTRNFQNQTG